MKKLVSALVLNYEVILPHPLFPLAPPKPVGAVMSKIICKLTSVPPVSPGRTYRVYRREFLVLQATRPKRGNQKTNPVGINDVLDIWMVFVGIRLAVIAHYHK